MQEEIKKETLAPNSDVIESSTTHMKWKLGEVTLSGAVGGELFTLNFHRTGDNIHVKHKDLSSLLLILRKVFS